MRRDTVKLKLTYDEIRILIFALNELRNSLIKEGRYTDAVDDMLIKIYEAKGRRSRVAEERPGYEC